MAENLLDFHTAEYSQPKIPNSAAQVCKFPQFPHCGYTILHVSYTNTFDVLHICLQLYCVLGKTWRTSFSLNNRYFGPVRSSLAFGAHVRSLSMNPIGQ